MILYTIPFWTLLASSFYVLFFYALDDSSVSGARAWAPFRRWRFWAHFNAVEYYRADWHAFQNVRTKCGLLQQQPRFLFVVAPNATYMSLISGFGLHAGYFEPGLRLLCLLPDVLFYVPLLREFLMWAGCVAERARDDHYGHVLELLRCGHSVALAFSKESSVPRDVFEFACKENVFVVPVWVDKERARYWIWSSERVARAQNYFLDWLRWPFPLLFFPRVFGAHPPPRLLLSMGMPMNPDVYKNDFGEFDAQFRRQLCDMGASADPALKV